MRNADGKNDLAYDERRAFAESTFKPDACDRLIQSNRQYQDTHGHYIPTLAWLLNETRKERDAARAALTSPEART